MGLDEKLALVYAGQPLPPQGTASVFLAGPTPRSADVQSWRPAAIREIAAQWQGHTTLAVLIPEPMDGQGWPYPVAMAGSGVRLVGARSGRRCATAE